MGNGEAEGPSTYEDMDVRVTACPLRTSPSAAALLPLSGVVDPTDPGLDSGRDQAASNGIPASRKRSQCAAVVSDFVSKLFSAISGSQFKNQIRWSEAGDSFIVVDQFEFAREVMPVLFSHTNYQSFVRQLNKYGFHKLKTGDVKMGSTGGMTAEFQHASFLRDHPELLGEITRKKNVSRKLEPEVASGVGRALFSATTSASPHISGTQIQRTSPTTLTTWEAEHPVPAFSSIPSATTSSFVNVMESRFNQLAEMQVSANINYSRASKECEAFQRELNYLKNAVVRQDLLMEHLTNIVSATMEKESKLQVLKEFQNALRKEIPPFLASSKPASLDSQPSSSHLPTPLNSAAPNSFDFSHLHFAPKPPLSFVKSGHLLPPNFTNTLTPFDAPDCMTTATSRRAPPTHQTHEHHYNYDASISFNTYLPQAGMLPQRATEKVLSHIAVNTNLERSSSASSLHEPRHVKQSYRAFIISDDVATRHALLLELNALSVPCEIIADQQSLRSICSQQLALYNHFCILFLDHDSCMLNIPATAKVIRQMNPAVNLMLMAARPNDVDFRFYKSVGLSECLGKPVSSLGLRHVFEKAQIWL
ncbi:hypothetical protein CcCBS67573_g07215 [Chytriomyces confervae]|uniref:HSF-type DNA-binding domain-containing protein n=1 Tax=Chytriomyces confervae TaxID=246404 RepID=A0A507EWN6_9FUNG|nr:hypothetical protein CcCBS67573_g07215 [Chytriomyces confervae]